MEGRAPEPAGPGEDRSVPVVVSAIIVTWNSREEVLACLRSLVSSSPSVHWEAIVVDNGSTDGTPAAVRRDAPWVHVIANPDNRGLAAANNQGMLAARGDYFLISNPDVIWQPGAVDALQSVMERRSRAAWVSPRLRYHDGVLQTSAGDLPRLADALIGRQGERLRRRRARTATAGLWWDEWAHDEERSIGRGHEAAYLVRGRAVEEVGPQDERYRLDWEGVEWTARLRAAGWEVWLAPDAEVIHVGGTSIRQVPYRWIVSSHMGMYRYFAARTTVALRPALAAAVGLRAAAKLGAAVAGAALYDRAFRSGAGKGG
jgi:GT2 family glycosyltransferase